MRITRWLWGLWGAMILSMMLRRQADTYMIVALIVIPILIVLMDLHEEIATLKEENKHQRKFVMDRYNVLLEKMKDVSGQVEKRLVVDFAEFAKNNNSADSMPGSPPMMSPAQKSGRKLKKRRKPAINGPDASNIDFTRTPPDQQQRSDSQPAADDFEDI